MSYHIRTVFEAIIELKSSEQILRVLKKKLVVTQLVIFENQNQTSKKKKKNSKIKIITKMI